MPGKYSHSVVLAHYSSRGIISIPNDQQTEYFTSAAVTQKRPVVTPTSTRPRASSSAARSDCQSVAQKSVKAPSERSQPAHYDLSLRERPAKGRRRLIIESESESEVDESSSQHIIRLHPKPRAIHPQTAATSPSARRSEVESKRTSVDHHVDRTEPRLSSPVQSPTQQFGGLLQSPSLKGSTYVKALTKVESRSPMDRTLASPRTTSTTDDSLTLFDFLRSQRRPETRDNESLSLQEFLSSMSLNKSKEPKPEHNPPHLSTALAHKSPISNAQPKIGSDVDHSTRPDHRPQRISSPPEVSNPVRVPLPGSGLTNVFETGSNKGLNLHHVSHQEETPDFMQILTVSNRPRSTAFPFSQPSRDTSLKRRSMGDSVLSQTPRRSYEGIPTSLQPAVGNPSAPRLMHRSRSRFDDRETSGSLGSLSSFSDFGIPSINRTPATSRQSNAPRSKAISEASYQSRGPARGEARDDLTLGIFEDSAEDEEEEIEEEMVESNMPIIDPDTIYSSTFGQISSGHDVHHDDAISEISAACPPDINRYKYAHGGGGPLAQLEQMMTEHNSPGPTKLSKPVRLSKHASEIRKNKPSKVGGLLERFKRSHH